MYKKLLLSLLLFSMTMAVSAQRRSLNIASVNEMAGSVSVGNLSSSISASSTTAGLYNVTNGTTVQIVATANAGYNFVCWREGVSIYSRTADTTITVRSNRSLTAVFVSVCDTMTLAVNDTTMGSIEMLYEFTPLDTVDLSTIQSDYTVQDGTMLTGTLGGNRRISVADGASIMLSNMAILGVHMSDNGSHWAGLTLLGDATIVLDGGTANYIRGFNRQDPGILVPVGATLTICGSGELTAESGNSHNTADSLRAAGIGGGYNLSCGNIVINGGTITTIGAIGASLGSGYHANCGNIAIHGGIVNASSIGCGNGAIIDSIIITGGTVNAVGKNLQSGIGTDAGGVVSHILITGGTVNAKGGANGAGIGCGQNGTCTDITITGGTVVAEGGIYAAGIGSGQYGHSYNITIASTVASVTAKKGMGGNDVKNIGNGDNGSGGTITVGGQPYTDPDSNVYTYTGTGDNSVQEEIAMSVSLADGRYSAPRGKQVVARATAKQGYHLDAWSDGAAVNAAGTDTITVNGATTLTAFFAQDSLIINVTVIDTNSGNAVVIYNDSAATSHLVEPDTNTVITISATAKYGYHFDRWEEVDTMYNFTLYSRTADTTVSATGDRWFYAFFEPNLYTIATNTADTNMGTAAVDNNMQGPAGTRQPSVEAEYNSWVMLTATPKPGYRFVCWREADSVYSHTADTFVVVTADRSFTAEFDISAVDLAITNVNLDVATSNVPQFTINVTNNGTEDLTGECCIRIYKDYLGGDTVADCAMSARSIAAGETRSLSYYFFTSDLCSLGEGDSLVFEVRTDSTQPDTIATNNVAGLNIGTIFPWRNTYEYVSDTVCDSLRWNLNNHLYRESGTYEYSAVTNYNGGRCDSIVVLDLTVNHGYSIDTFAIELDSYNWHGNEFRIVQTATFTSQVTMQTATGCDSTVTLHLMLIPTDTVTLLINDTTMGSIELAADTIHLDTLTADFTAQDGAVLTGRYDGAQHRIYIADGATVTLAGIDIPGRDYIQVHEVWNGITCLGDATLLLADGTMNKVNAYEFGAGIFVPQGNTLAIYGSTGWLNATSPSGAGIGGGTESTNIHTTAGNIVIYGGNIIARCSEGSGIGSYTGTCGDITIHGGNIYATSLNSGAAIGSGAYGYCGNILITGGTVSATSGGYGAAIGTGLGDPYAQNGVCGDITIMGGNITALTQTYRDLAAIGAGTEGFCGNILIAGGTVDATGPVAIGANIGHCGDIVVANTVTRMVSHTTYNYAFGDSYGAHVTIGNSEGISYSFTADTDFYGTQPLLHPAPVSINYPSLISPIGDGLYRVAQNQNVVAKTTPISCHHFVSWSTADSVLTTHSSFIIHHSSLNQYTNTPLLATLQRDIYTSDTTVHAVNHYTWNGTEYTTGGDIQDSLYTAEGCDSLATLHLTLDYIDTITLAVNDTSMGSIAIEGAFTPTDTVDLATLTADYTAQDGTVLTGTLTNDYKISVAAGASVMLKGIIIPGIGTAEHPWAGLSLLGDATLFLDDSSYVKGYHYKYPGIHVPAGSTLTIRGEGILTAQPCSRAAAIGGGYEIDNGNIVIESGTIHAHGYYAAGIGGGYRAQSCGNITIRGGHIDASSIGGGDSETIDSITITGGTVIATGNDFEAGVGTGHTGTVNHIIITGGTVIAQGGSRAAGIGGGIFAHCGEIVIDSTVTLVTSSKGNLTDTNIGTGFQGTFDTIIVAGQGYTDVTTPFSYTGNGTGDQGRSAQPMIIGLGGNSYRIERGKTVNISAIPNSIYYRLANWTEADTAYSRTADTAVTITHNRTLTAVFESNLQHITVGSSEGGNGHVAAACENFDSYTVGNHVAAEAIAHGNNSWTTWYRAPGTDADGTIANINGSNCAHFVRGNDQVMLFGDIADGVYDLQFDLMVPNGKDGYFNVLHYFDSRNSIHAMEAYLHLYDSYTPNPGHADLHAGQHHAAVMPCVYDTWMHFRVHVDFDDDSAQLYYSLPGESDSLIHSWQWSLTASGWIDNYKYLSAVDFYPLYSDSTSEFYVDNIVLNRSNNNYPRGTQCNLTATPDEHYHFVCWMEADSVYSRSADTVINVTGDRTFTALFAIDQHYIATACNDTSMGSTSVAIGGAPSQGNSTSAVADYGTTATITATPKFGYHFVRWEEDTSLYSRAADTTVDVTSDRYFYALFERTYDTIILIVNDTSMGRISLTGVFSPTYTVNLDTIQADYTVQDGTVLTGTLGGNYKISVAAGASIMLSNMNITGVFDSSYTWAGLNLLGDATILLDDSTTNHIRGFFNKYPGIHVPVGATLTIRGKGELTAESGKNQNASYRWMAAGIGGGYDVPSGSIVIESGIINTIGGYGASLGGGYNAQRRDCGNIAIHGGTVSASCIGGGYNAFIDTLLITGGTVTAAASTNQAGIGCDGSGILNHLIITGGTINATGGSNGAGIGGGRYATVNHITITGGTITATGGSGSAGIGSGYYGSCGDIVIASSVTSVTAIKSNSGDNNTQTIGHGYNGSCGNITVGGQSYTASQASSYTYLGDGTGDQSPSIQPDIITLGDNIYSIARGTNVVVQATPYPGYHLADWSDGTAVNTDNTDTLMVNGSMWLTAIFQHDAYLISATAVDTAMGSAVVIFDDTVAATLPVLPDSTFILEATANPCHHFVCWTKGADTVASESIIELPATDTSFYMAHFERNLPLLGDTTAVVCDSLLWFGTAYTDTDTATHNLLTAEGCDSTVTLHLTVKYSTSGDTSAVVCDLFMWYDSIYTATSAPTHRFTNAVGCDSTVTLNLTVNYKNTGDTLAVVCDSFAWYGDTYTASNDSLTHFMEAANQWGCDSTVTLHLTVNYQNTGDTTAVECDQFSWYEHHGLTASTDTLTHLLANRWGCDSTVTLHLTVNYRNTGDTAAVSCDHFTWYEHTRVTASTDTLTHLFVGGNQWGCDSTVTLHLTVNYQNTGDTAAVECDQFSWYEHQNITASDSTRTHLFAAANQWGCDSTVTLHLTVNYQNTGDTSAVVCDSFSWYEHLNITVSDTTRTHLLAAANRWGCDSTVTLHLTVNYQNTGDTSAVVCDSLVWYDSTYTLSAAPTHLFANQWGCDSTVTLHLTVNYSSSSDTSAVECDQFLWCGVTYTASGDPERHYTNAVSCDSTRTLHLTINYQNTGDTNAVECDSFSWYDSLFTASASPTHLLAGANRWGCDSTVTLHLTVNYQNTGDTTAVECDSFSWYEHQGLTASVDSLTHLLSAANRWGCDSTVTLHLTVNYQNTGDTSAVACDSFSWYEHHNITLSDTTRTHLLAAANRWGCDSTVTLHLTVNYQNTGDTTAVACDSFSWYEHPNLTASDTTRTHLLAGANRWGCDSTVTLHLTVNYQNTGDTAAVTYLPYSWYEHLNIDTTQDVQHTFHAANRWGCDSTVTLHLRFALFTTIWSGDTTVIYNSSPQTSLSAAYVDDTGRIQQVQLTFTKGTETITTPSYPVSAGTWLVTARPLLPVDSLRLATSTLTILPATVSVTGATALTAKVADGTTDATVTNIGTLNNIQGDDPLTHNTTAAFSDSQVGTGKTITLTYTLQGPPSLLANYTLDHVTEIYSISGAIVDAIAPDPSQTAFSVEEYGYCSGTGTILYHLASGTPDQYKIDYADSRFADIDWTDLPTPGIDGSILIQVPDELPTGDYDLSVTFRDSRYPWIESAPVAATIHVDLPASYLQPLFYNVIILIDTCECFTDIQWYHRPAGGQWAPIPGANDYHYREPDKLNGEYFASLRMWSPDRQSSILTYTCPQTDVTTLVRDPEPAEPTVSAHPNPATAAVTVEISHSDQHSHLLRVVNTMGVPVLQQSFDGPATTLDITSWQTGSYIVSVDGLIVRIIKN